jgi:V/A-type H+/Na+-transporting ATPase subunit D
MAKIKHTKNELKAQKEALRRYERFLPMLQLKKQQLQAEIQSLTHAIAEREARGREIEAGVARWVKLLAEPVALDRLVTLREVRTTEGNIAGVAIPVMQEVVLETAECDLFATPPWVDEAADAFGGLLRLRAEMAVLDEQRRLISEELRTTSQRVNLFEKVKIPECRENIRVIRIFLGDEQTAGVARGKMAKRRTETEEDAPGAGAEAA